MGDDWPKIQAEREACADLFEITDARTVGQRHVVQGLDGARRSPATSSPRPAQSPVVFFSRLAKVGFSFNKMVAADAKRCGAGDPSSLAALMRAGALRRNHPPGPVTAMLGEAVVHGEDIRRPLGVARNMPEGTLVTVADFYKGSNLLIGAKRRISGLRLRATDSSWSHGDGPEVSGPPGLAGRGDDWSSGGVLAARGRRRRDSRGAPHRRTAHNRVEAGPRAAMPAPSRRQHPRPHRRAGASCGRRRRQRQGSRGRR